MAKIDFLRHIVNRVLAEANAPRQLVDDVRKLVGRAEDTYKFSVFGGDVRRLADYLRSREFDDLVAVFRSTGSLNLLVTILEKAKQAYSDYDEVVEAIEQRLKELKTGEEDAKTRVETLYHMLKPLMDKGLTVNMEPEKLRVLVEKGDSLRVVITYDKERKTYTIEYKVGGSITTSSLGTIVNLINTLLDALKRITSV